jgi:hypothetical protein
VGDPNNEGTWVDTTSITVNGGNPDDVGPAIENGNVIFPETITSPASLVCGIIPSGRVIGASIGVGGVGAATGGGELVLNYDTGQVSGFGFAGFQMGWNGVLSASGYTGVAYGLSNDNSNYKGGFSGASFGIPIGGIFRSVSSGGLTQGTAGLTPSRGSGTVSVTGVSVGAALVGKWSGGANATNYTPALQLGKFWAFTPLDMAYYFARQACK